MRRSLIFGLTIAAAGTVYYWSACIIVPPHAVAVITRGDSVVRVEQPGLRWHVPLLERVGHISVTRHYETALKVNAKLSDGSGCRIVAVLITRAADPVKAYRWRLARNADVSADSLNDVGKVYTAASRVFRTQLLAVVAKTTPDKAASGGIEAWISQLHDGPLEDGTTLLQARPATVSCSRTKTVAQQSVEKFLEPTYGALMPFVRTISRPDTAPTAIVHRFVLPKFELIARDARVVFEGLAVAYRIKNAEQFKNVHGNGGRAILIANSRLGNRLLASLRQVASSTDVSAIATFDPLIVVGRGIGGAGVALDNFGVEIIDFGGKDAGYRLQLPSK